MKKIDYNYAKDCFLKNNCILLENNYKNAKHKMNYVCICGNISYISWDNFKNGHRCGFCKKGIKLDYYKVAEIFKEAGCILLENNYKNSKHKMNYVCICGNISNISLSNFKNGKRCGICGNNKKPTQNEVCQYFLDNGCVLLGNYKNAVSNLEYICVCGNKSKIRFYVFKQGQRCRECFRLKMSGENNHNWNPDREEIKWRRIFRSRCYSYLRVTLLAIGKKKVSKSRELLGYSYLDLKEYLQNHKNWQFVRDKAWCIDHVFPIQAFMDYGIHNVKLINSLDNLQPLLKSDNRKKWHKYDKLDFEIWLQNKGDNLGV